MDSERNQHLRQLFEENYQAIYRRCYWIVGFNPQYHQLIEDCIQDAFVKATSHYDDYKDYENPVGWITITACNRLKSELRREKRRNKNFVELEPEQLEQVAASSVDVESLFDRQEILDHLSRIYDSLTDKEKLIFHEYFLERKKMREVAADHGMKIGAVRSGIKRIRKRAKTTRNLGVILFFLGFYRFWSIH